MPRVGGKKRIISLDTETTGLDLYHRARPFFVTICGEDGAVAYWEWDVDPMTREPSIPPGDLDEIQGEIDRADVLVLQNTKFDYKALQTVYGGRLRWDWSRVRDTLLAGHLLASNQPHDLTSMALVYLGVNIKPLEDDLERACQEARRLAKAGYPEWVTARKGNPEMPSVRESTWQHDMWLPRAIARDRGYPPDHPWWTVLSDYSNGDSSVTLPLWIRQRELIQEKKLDRIYAERLRLLPVVCSVESYGVTLNRERLYSTRNQYRREADRCRRVCANLSGGRIKELPLSGTSNALKSVVYEHFGLKSNKRTKKGNDSMDSSVLDHWVATLPAGSKPRSFIVNLKAYRKRMTAVSYMDNYERFWLPTGVFNGDGEQLWYRIHPSLNPTGTDTLRWSSSNPNEQSISKQEGFNLRYAFGPMPGREWYSLDYQNLELRIPAFEAGETDAVYVFEHPDEAPYFGSYHLLVADLLHPAEFRRHGTEFRKVYESTRYKWVKNGNFAVIYGAQESTADRSYHVPGAYSKIRRRFPRIAALNDRMIELANRRGYVETIPDRTVDPDRGYPIYCARTAWGKALPTVPLNYHVQSTAMWCTSKAMVRCHEYLQGVGLGDDYRLIMQVHDENVFDMPVVEGGNRPVVDELRRLMEMSGGDIGVPTPVSVEHYPGPWSKGD
jgi:DNA polymerase I-like protein with 3'-5' exonuclease and polymerase domains